MNEIGLICNMRCNIAPEISFTHKNRAVYRLFCPFRQHVSDKLAQLITYPNVTVYSAIAGLNGLDLELVHTSDLLLDINPGRKVVEILDAFRFENKPILGFEDLKSTKHNQQTYSRDRWKEMAETIRQMRKKSL